MSCQRAPGTGGLKHREEKNVASVSWIHVSAATVDKSHCFSLLALALFVFKPCLFAEIGAFFYDTRYKLLYSISRALRTHISDACFQQEARFDVELQVI